MDNVFVQAFAFAIRNELYEISKRLQMACKVEKACRKIFPDFVDDFIVKSLSWRITHITFYIGACVQKPKLIHDLLRKSQNKNYQPFSLVHPSHNTLIKLKQHHVINHNRLLEEKPINHWHWWLFHQ